VATEDSLLIDFTGLARFLVPGLVGYDTPSQDPN
jgi:hypothetical protein